jgi:hypothetical protein
MAPKFKFPNANDYPLKVPAVLCPADRVINLYNQDSGSTAQRISKSVREWFFQRAHQEGWGGAHFLPEVQSQHGAGCVLWVGYRGVPQTIQVTQQTLILLDSPEED